MIRNKFLVKNIMKKVKSSNNDGTKLISMKTRGEIERSGRVDSPAPNAFTYFPGFASI